MNQYERIYSKIIRYVDMVYADIFWWLSGSCVIVFCSLRKDWVFVVYVKRIIFKKNYFGGVIIHIRSFQLRMCFVDGYFQ